MREVTLQLPDGKSLRPYLMRLGAFLLVVYVAYLVREIWLPLALAFLIAMVLDPVVDRMESRGWTRPRATIFIFGGFLLIFGGLLVLAWPYVLGQALALQESFTKYFPDTTRPGLLQSFKKLGVPDGLADAGVGVFQNGQRSIKQSGTWLTDYGMRFVSNLIWVVIVPIVAFYALRDFHLILAKALMIVPRGYRNVVQTAVTETSAVFARFLRGLATVSALNGVATWLLLAILHVPSALILGIIAGLLYGVPYIGAIITTLLTAAIAFLAGGLPLMTVAVVASVILHQIIFDQIITPRILGGHVGLHPILSIIALLSGNLLLGIVGMILAVPIAACIQIGILALVPKLSTEIDIPSSPDPGHNPDDLLADHLQAQEPADLHQMIERAVNSVEREARDAG